MPEARCTRCGSVLARGAAPGNRCPRCLIKLGLVPTGQVDDFGTLRDSSTPTSDDSGFGSQPPPGPTDGEARFIPGQTLLGRYRIVALLGRGGMGEVYRADDLRLGQPVALKFLPEDLERQGELLSRLLNEVRIARLITHPNVCRVYDIGEVAGQVFFSMEYVDGEDLSTLLRRIGRLPRDKAVQIARQLCQGLAAAHRRGVLHRDVKPANVMIDGLGQVRITDFGVSAVGDSVRGLAATAGTPAYMAPEQRSRGEATARSDIYSLGLVLYELFTGRHPWPGTPPREPTRDGATTLPVPPSRHVPGLDPTLDRVILRCLDPDPRQRPASPLEVAAELPGSDPLAAALAAGETPSPELVAIAGGTGALPRRVAWSALLAVLLGVGLIVSFSQGTQLSRLVPLEVSAELLGARAVEVAAALGYRDAPRDRVYGFSFDTSYLSYIADGDVSPRRWQRLRDTPPSAIAFWFRQSPRHLVRLDLSSRRVTYDDPPLDVPGMLGVHLDPVGRLRGFDAVPPEFDTAPAAAVEPDWSVLFAEAGLDLAAFEPATPTWNPRVYADQRRAWAGDYPGRAAIPIRVEAAALHGRVVGFRIVEPWTTSVVAGATMPNPMFHTVRKRSPSVWSGASQAAYTLVLLGGLIGGTLIARRNLRAGRGHREGATKLAAYLFVTGLLTWVLGEHHVAGAGELQMALRAVAGTLFWSLVAWVFYVALEPYLRSIWPRTIVSWIRVLEGRLRDPLVGRHVLAGCVLGAGLGLLLQLYQLAPEWLGMTPPRPDGINSPANELDALRGLAPSLAGLLTIHCKQLFYGLLYACVLLLLRLAVRRDWLAVVPFLVLSVLLVNPAAGHPLVDLGVSTVLAALCLVGFFRFGLLTVIVALNLAYLSGGLTLTFDMTAWYAPGSAMVVTSFVGLAVYGFVMALGGKTPIRDVVFEE